MSAKQSHGIYMATDRDVSPGRSSSVTMLPSPDSGTRTLSPILQLSIAGRGDRLVGDLFLLEPSEVKRLLRHVRREFEGANRGLLREATLMENKLARIEERAERWVKRRQGADKQLAFGSWL